MLACMSPGGGVDSSDLGGAAGPDPRTPSPRGSRDDARGAGAAGAHADGETVIDILLEMADTLSDFAVPEREDSQRSGLTDVSTYSGPTRGQYLQRMLVAGGVSRGSRLLRVNHAVTASRGVLLVEAGMNPVRRGWKPHLRTPPSRPCLALQPSSLG